MPTKVTPPERPRDASNAPYSGGLAHINANTGVKLVTGPCYLGGIVINDPGTSWTLAVYDGTDSNGTLVANIKPSASGGNFVYDGRLNNGLYILPSGTTAGSATVVCGSL